MNAAQALTEAPQQTEDLTVNAELETPEVFTLPSPPRKRVTVKVRKVEPARFYFVAEENAILEDAEDGDGERA